MTVSYREAERFVELYFSEIPDETLRETLKVCGWRWYKPSRCWRNFRNSENLLFAKNLYESLNPKKKSYLEDVARCILSEQNILVRSNGFYCNSHHMIKDLAGEVIICDYQGDLYKYLFPITWCVDCNIIYVLEETYLDLKKHGVIMCQVMSHKQYIQSLSDAPGSDMVLRSESFLKILGYSVNTAEDLSEEQRHAILERAIDKGVLSKDRVLSYLDFFIKQHPHNFEAVRKWRSDRNYIGSYKIGLKPRIVVKTFILE